MTRAHPAADAQTGQQAFDVVIVGGGIAGSAAAARLGARHRTAFVDMHATYPPDFRADKVGGSQIALMSRLGLAAALDAHARQTRGVARIQHGRVVDRGEPVEYNLPYEVLVNDVRDLIPPSVHRVSGRAASVEASDDGARVTMASGEVLTARLLVLATGLGDAMRRQLGITRQMLRAAHSVTIGFDIARAPDAPPLPADTLCLYGERPKDGIDYLSIFPFPGVLRANLFVYREPSDSFYDAFAADPKRRLLEAFPGLEVHLGDFSIEGRVHKRPIDLYETQGHRRAGVVLLGDAFRSGCPAVGSGLNRALTDVETLDRLLPDWLATPGMDATKIAAFYDDPAKRACDAKAAHDAEYRRASTIGTGLRWTLHRARVDAQERVRGLVGRLRRREEAVA